MATYQKTQKILFQHCDPAGIVFYPRYFEMINALVESWFEEEIGYSFERMHLDLKTGIPTVHTDFTFRNPSRLGEVLNLELLVKKLGRSSIICDVTAKGSQEQTIRFEGQVTLVYFDMTTGKSKSMPVDMIEKLTPFMDTNTIQTAE